MPYNVDGYTFNAPDDLEDEDFECEDIGICPLCNIAARPDTLTAYEFDRDLYVFCHCVSCQGVFIAQYRYTGNTYAFIDAFPKNIISASIPNSIEELSPDFKVIYSQAEAAESHGLNEICGLGYRKAIEFLIKDYLCYLNPAESEAIKSEQLGKCIQARIPNIRIKTLAERIAWIGNDEAHYVKKHDECDLKDMKRFIHAMVTFIDAECALREAENILPKK